MTITEQIMHMGSFQFWIGLVVLTGIAIACFIGAFSLLRRARLIEDTPTARIRSAAQGYVELSGIAHPDLDNKVVSPLTDSDCCWYRYAIERKSGKNWHTLEKGSSEYPFIIEDETGRCIILPRGAEVTPTDQSTWYGSSRQPEDRDPARQRIKASVGSMRIKVDTGFSGEFKLGSLFTHYRYTEERIYPGDVIYALGHFRSLDELDHHQSRSKITTEILRFWKKDQKRMLERFDQDGDGRIDAQEWDAARQSASRIAQEKQEALQKEQIVHTLSKSPHKGFPYLISSLPEFNLVKRYRVWSGVILVVFFLSGSGAVFLLSSRL